MFQQFALGRGELGTKFALIAPLICLLILHNKANNVIVLPTYGNKC